MATAASLWLMVFSVFPPSSQVAQAAEAPSSLQIRVVAGEGLVHVPGSRNSSSLVVEVLDEAGHAVSGAVVSFRLPSDGPGGVFQNALKTDLMVTGTDGRATISGFRPNEMEGAFQIRVTAARDHLRAGTIITQSVGTAAPATARTAGNIAPASPETGPRLAETGSATPSAEPSRKSADGRTGWTPGRNSVPSSRKKWLLITAIAAGAAGGLLGGYVARSNQSGVSGTTAPPPTAAGIQIGNPTVSVGKP